MSSRKRTTRTSTSKAESLKRAKAVQEELWQGKVLNRIDEINKVLTPYRRAVNDICNAKYQKLSSFNSACLNERLTLSRKNDEIRHNLCVLEIKRLKTVESFVEFTETHPIHFAQGSWSFKRHFADLKDNNSVDGLLSHLRELREECVSHIDRVVELISQRKEEYTLIFKEIDDAIEIARKEMEDIIKQLKTLYETQTIQQKEIKKKLEEEEKAETGSLRTPEIQQLYDEVASIQKEWDEEKGEKCERCGKIQKLSVAGWVESHLTYRRNGNYFTCDTSSSILSLIPSW
jgi:hypothetical protein